MNRLDKYIKQVRGISYSPNDISEIPLENYLPILKANNIQENGLDTSSLIYIHESKIKKEQLIKRGDLLLAASSGSKDIVGKNVFFENDYNGSFGAFCKVVRPNQNIYPKFLGVFFKTPVYKRHIRNLIQGANINNLRNEDIDSLKIPDFSKKDQINIANILTIAENLISQRKEIIRLLDEYLKSKFSEMFGDNFLNSSKYALNELKSGGNGTFSNGPFGSDLLTTELKDEGVPVIYIRDIRNGVFEWKSNVYVTEQKSRTLVNCQLQSNDVIIAKVGDPPGISAIYPNSFGLGIITQDVIRIRLNHNIVLPKYFTFFINSDKGKQLIKKITIEGTRKRFSLGDFKKLTLNIPPLDLQARFAQIVEKTETLKAQYQLSLKELENLYGSLSQRAFKGELSFKDETLLIAAEPDAPYKHNHSA